MRRKPTVLRNASWRHHACRLAGARGATAESGDSSGWGDEDGEGHASRTDRYHTDAVRAVAGRTNPVRRLWLARPAGSDRSSRPGIPGRLRMPVAPAGRSWLWPSRGTVRLARRVVDQTAPDRYRDRDLKGRRLSQLDTGAGEWPNAECCPALVPTRAPLRRRCGASAHRLGLAREYRMPCRRAGTVADPFANAEMKVKRPSNPDASRPHKIPKDDPSSCWKLLRPACDLNPQSRSSNFSTEPPEQQPDQAEHTGAPSRIRTYDTRFRKPLLYPLSYGG